MKVRFKGRRGVEQHDNIVHVVPIANPKKAGIKFKNGGLMFIDWTDLLKIEND